MKETQNMTQNKQKALFFKTWKTKTLAALFSVVAAVALPQLVHAIGAASGMGSSLGEALLPMHLAIFMVGLLAGWGAGLAAGICAPILSFALSGMPRSDVLPFMIAELAAYGLTAGLLAEMRLPCFFKLVVAQIAGRSVRAVIVLIAFYGLHTGLPVSSIWTGLAAGLPGILLQWAIVPLLMFRIEKGTRKDD